MTTQSTTKGPDFAELFKEEFVVLLLRGKNNFGDLIYSYVKVTYPNIKRMQESLSKGGTFHASDYGEVIAAGTGEPTDEVKREIAAQYPVMDQKLSGGESGGSAAAPVAKKAWDEY